MSISVHASLGRQWTLTRQICRLGRLASLRAICTALPVVPKRMAFTGSNRVLAQAILQEHGIDVSLVKARNAGGLAGRKTGICDASWLRQLHSCGLPSGSFRPTTRIAMLRTNLRQREPMAEYAAALVQHLQKALMEMNLQRHHFFSDSTGTTGMRIIRAIIAGKRDPDLVAPYRDV